MDIWLTVWFGYDELLLFYHDHFATISSSSDAQHFINKVSCNQNETNDKPNDMLPIIRNSHRIDSFGV